MRITRFPLAVWAVAVGAALVSLTGSWIPSLWGDEAASVLSAQRSIPSLFTMLGTIDAVHGTYYLLLHFWVEAFGASPFAVRLPSALAVGATAAGVTLVARRLAPARVAIAAGIICAVIPRVTYMGTETRSYALGSAIVAGLTWLLLRLIEQRRPARRWWIAYAALFCVGVYVFIYIVLVFAAHAVIVVSSRVDRGFALRWAGSAAAALAVSVPVLAAAVHQRGQVAFLADRETTTPRALLLEPWFVTPLFAAIAVAVITLAVLVAIAGRSSGVRAVGMPRLEVVACAWLFVPAVLLLAGHTLEPVYAARYLSSSAPAAALLMALGLDFVARRHRRALAAGLVAVALCAAPAWVEQRQPFAKNDSDFAQVSGIVAAHAEAGDAIAFDESVRPSRRPRLALHLYPEGFAGLRDVTIDVPYPEGTSWHDSAYGIAEASRLGRLDGVTRLWLVERSRGERDRSELAALGFTEAARYDAHSSVVYEFTRG